MLLNLVLKMKFHTKLSCSGRNHTILLLMLVAEKVLLLLVISLTDYAINHLGERIRTIEHSDVVRYEQETFQILLSMSVWWYLSGLLVRYPIHILAIAVHEKITGPQINSASPRLQMNTNESNRILGYTKDSTTHGRQATCSFKNHLP